MENVRNQALEVLKVLVEKGDVEDFKNLLELIKDFEMKEAYAMVKLAFKASRNANNNLIRDVLKTKEWVNWAYSVVSSINKDEFKEGDEYEDYDKLIDELGLDIKKSVVKK